QNWRGDEDRRRSPDDDAKYDRQRKPAHHLTPNQSERQDREDDGQRSGDSTAEGLIDAEIDQLPQRHCAKLREILANAIVNDELVADGIADQRQQRRHGIEDELDLRNTKESDRFGNIEDQRGDDTDAELPFEAEPDVEQNSEEGECGRHQAIMKQLT